MSSIMNQWTDELRYAPYSSWTSAHLENLTSIIAQSSWRFKYHIQPQTGLLNDPNGFSYFNNQWHLFYQAFPFGSVHGLKSWAHLTSSDLIHWEYEGIALYPDSKYDSHGVYSGSALPIDNQLCLFYTGNVRDQTWQRFAYQNIAWLNSLGAITKESTPFLPIDPNYSSHFRDPMVFPYQEGLVLLIGASDLNGQGKIVVYFSKDRNVHNFHQLGELTFTDQELGYMVECPNLVFIDGQPVLLFCPQGLSPSVKSYQNIYPNMYTLAETFDLENLSLVQAGPFENLDEGFDVYATQAFNAPDGRALAVSWIGLPEITYPSDVEGWANGLSLVKELTIHNGKLFQYPVSETEMLRQSATTLSNGCHFLSTASFELEVDIPKNEIAFIRLLANETGSKGLLITIDTIHGKITLDRTFAGQPFAEKYGTIRETKIRKNKSVQLTIFVDCSVAEIYVNKGEKTMTGRFFPDKAQQYLHLSKTAKACFYELENTNN